MLAPQIMRSLCLAVSVVVLAGCGSTAPRTSQARAVTEQYKDWTILITPQFSSNTNQWRAAVLVWPPDADQAKQPGINVHVSEVRDQRVIMEAAREAAHRYIDASRTEQR
jgi:hypothetical protein